MGDAQCYEIPIGRLSRFGRPLCCFFTIVTLVPTMGRQSTNSATQAKTKIKTSNSKSPKASTSVSSGTRKPPSITSKESRAVESDDVDVDGLSEGPPSKRKKITVVSTTPKKVFDDKVRPLTSKKHVQSSKSKPAKSPLTAANTGGSPDPKFSGKKQKAVAEPAEAGSEESEEEWVGFGHASEEEGEGDGDDDSSEEEPLHGLSSDDDDQDSSDEEVEFPSIDVSKLPTIAKDDKIVKQKLEKAKRQPVRISLAVTSSLFHGSNSS